MTEHGKARRNRLRDLQAFHEHAHRYNENTIAVGVIVVNASEYYWSPTRDRHDVTVHRNIERLVKETVDIYRGLPLIASTQEATGFEAVTVIVVKHDNLLKNPELPQDYVPQTTSLVSGPLAPQVGDPLHYSSMMYRVCEAFKERFC